MLVEDKWLVTSMRDVFQGLVNSFAGIMGDTVADGNVRLAFKDERPSETRTYPAVTLYLYDAAINYAQRPGGVNRVVADHATDETKVSISKMPIPIKLFLQADTWADKLDDDWAIGMRMMQYLGAGNTKVLTPAEKEFYVAGPIIAQPLDEIMSENLWRKAYRFALEVWFPHPDPAEDVYRVLVRRFNMEGELYQPDSFPE